MFSWGAGSNSSSGAAVLRCLLRVVVALASELADDALELRRRRVPTLLVAESLSKGPGPTEAVEVVSVEVDGFRSGTMLEWGVEDIVVVVLLFVLLILFSLTY